MSYSTVLQFFIVDVRVNAKLVPPARHFFFQTLSLHWQTHEESACVYSYEFYNISYQTS